MKNIAIIIPSLKGGGAERAVSTLTKSLPKNRYKIYLILFDTSNMEYDYYGELVDLEIAAKNNPLMKFSNFIKRLIKLKQIKKTYNINVSISFLPGPNLLNILTKGNEKIILSVRSNVLRAKDNIYRKIDDLIIKWLYNKADFITVVSQGIKNDLLRLFRVKQDKLKVLYNSYYLNEIEELSKESLSIDEKALLSEKVVVTVGRLENVKGHLHLIRAFSQIRQFNKDIKLIILGEGDLRLYLEELIKSLDLEDTVYMPGFVKNPYKYIKNSKLFVLPSLTEGFPNALAEAMACGIPVISSDCKTGPREILAPGSDINFQCDKIEYADGGILVPVCDGKNYGSSDPLTKEELILAEAILKITGDEELARKYSIAAKQRIREFDIKNIIKEWEKIL
ncbi:glycosyltransferase [Rossellomorea vietnamensis]|uniref:glycosyltransferase n=1 Tax=Rossellomorea vietnamensis TaxID=218284 RepID=UPI003CF1E03D